MAIAEANGQRLYYEVHGEGEPLLLVMGLGADSLAWILQIPAWSERYRVIAFDNRDVGRSSYCEDQAYELSDMAADALALADELGLDTFHLVGLSMGGAIAQNMAFAAPERIRTLTLCVTWGGSGAAGEFQARIWAPQVLRASFEERVDELLFRCYSEEFFEDPERVELARNMTLNHPYPQSAEGFVRQLSACGRHELRDRLGELRMPVHVIGAEHDILVPVWKSNELAELIPGAKLTIVERGAHGMNWERLDEFNRLVLDFIDSAAREGAAA